MENERRYGLTLDSTGVATFPGFCIIRRIPSVDLRKTASMKTSVLNHVFRLTLLLCSTIASFAVPVTFQVDLSIQKDIGRFKPQAGDGLDVRGTFNAWAGGLAVLSPHATNTNIYTGTFDVEADPGTAQEFKFVIVPGDGSAVIWEGRSNRNFTLEAQDQTLPVLFFDDLAVNPGAGIPVTFQVNMGFQRSAGAFDPEIGQIIEVRGPFNNWGTGYTLTNSPANTNLYSGTFNEKTASPGTAIPYKFVIFDTNTLSVTWESIPDRTFALASTNQVLDEVYFNNANGEAQDTQVTFQVNMAVQTSRGAFNPATDTVEVRGVFNNWAATGLLLTSAAGNTNLYVGTFPLNGVPGAALQYKFVIASTVSAEVWESIDNRVFSLESSAQTLPIVFFNNLEVDPGTGVPVTFQVDLATQLGDGTFDPSTNSVVVRGSFNGWAGEWRLTNSSPSTNIYTGTFNITASPGSTNEFKFVILGRAAGDLWENDIGNRVFILAAAAQTLPLASFNVAAPVGLGTIAITMTVPNTFMLSWSAMPGVRVQSSTNLTTATWTDVANTDGQSSVTVTASGPQTFFRLIGP